MNFKLIILWTCIILGIFFVYNFIKKHSFLDLFSYAVVVFGLIMIVMIFVIAKKEAGTNG